MTICSLAAPEAALVRHESSEPVDPDLARAFAALDAISADWPTVDADLRPFAVPEDAIDRFNDVDIAEAPISQTETSAAPETETTPERAAPKGWLSRIRKAVKTGKEWIAGQRDRITIAVGSAAIAMTVSEGKEMLDALEVKGTLGGAMKVTMELMANTSASEQVTTTGAFSVASFSAIGMGLVMRNSLPRQRNRPNSGEVSLSELLAPGQEQALDREAFAGHLVRYQRLIYEIDEELQRLAEEDYATV